MSPRTIEQVKIGDQDWHIYRRGEGGPLAISVNAGRGGHLSLDMGASVMRIIGAAMIQAAHKYETNQ